MANISQIKLPDDTAYNLKDNSGTISSHLHHNEDLKPLISKTYASTSYCTSSNTWDDASWYFMSIKPDAWYKPWTVKFKVRTFCPTNEQYDSITYSTVSGRCDSWIYANWNERLNTTHTYLVFCPLKQAGFDNDYGHALGISIYNATARTTYRTFEIDYYECENCTVTILDTPVKRADWTGMSSTNYGDMLNSDAYSRGLQESGDASEYNNRIVYFSGKTGAQGVWNGSLFMEDGNGTYQNICTASDGTATSSNRTVATTKLANANGFKVGSPIWECINNYNANANITGYGHVYSDQGNPFDSRYSFNTTLTANSLTPYAQVYLVGTINSTDGLFYLDQTWWTQTPNATDKVYVLVGACYDSTTSNCRIVLYEHNKWYKYNGSRLVEIVDTSLHSYSADSVNGHSVNADVPANAVFTDTTYTGTGNISVNSSTHVISTTAEVNQNAFSNVKVGSTTVAADSKTDTLELVQGANVTLTPDATNDKVTIAATDTTYTISKGDGAGQIKVTPSSGSEYNVDVKGMEEGYLNIHPENNPVLIPFMNNDIAYLTKKGGSAIIKYDGVEQPSVSLKNIFDASPSYLTIDSRDKSEVVIEMTLHKAFSWSNIVYIDFGSVSWGAKSIKFEVMNSNYEGDTWTQKFSTTTNAQGHCRANVSHQPVGASNTGAGFNKLRVTLADWQSATSSGLRIAQVGIYNYGSYGLRETFLPKDGGEMYNATVNPATNNTGSIGTSAKKWANGYFTNINGVAVGNSPKFTDTTYTGTGLISISNANVISTTAEVNQNAFSNIKVGSTTIAADNKTDTLELVEGDNVTLTPDSTNDKVTIAAKDTTYTLDNNGSSVRLTPSSGSGQSVSLSTLVNGLDEGTASSQADDYIVTQYAGGGTSNTNYYRRKLSKVINGTLVKSALGTDTSTTTQFLNKKGEWATPTGTTYTGTGLISINSNNVISTTAEANQNAFSNVKVGNSTIQADSKTDTLEIVAGNNVTLTPDTTNDKLTINATDTTYTFAEGGDFGTIKINGTDQSIKLKPTVISTENEDLDDYTGAGLYYFKSANPPTNSPESGTYGYLLVIPYSSETLKQIWFRQTTASSNAKKTFIRTSSVSSNVVSWTNWIRFAMTDDLVDENVKQIVTGSSSTRYRVLLTTSDSDTEETGNVRKCDGLTYQADTGSLRLARPHTSTSATQQQFVVGNNIPDGTAGNSRGVLALYSRDSYYVAFQDRFGAVTANRNYELPDQSGMLALRDNIARAKLDDTWNLLSTPYYYTSGTDSSSNITYTTKGDGSITMSGTAESTFNFFVRRYIEGWTLPPGKYKVAGCPSGGSTSTYYMRIGTATSTSSGVTWLGYDTGTGFEFTLTEERILAINASIYNGYAIQNSVTFNPVLIRLDGGWVDLGDVGTGMTITFSLSPIFNEFMFQINVSFTSPSGSLNGSSCNVHYLKVQVGTSVSNRIFSSSLSSEAYIASNLSAIFLNNKIHFSHTYVGAGTPAYAYTVSIHAYGKV